MFVKDKLLEMFQKSLNIFNYLFTSNLNENKYLKKKFVTHQNLTVFDIGAHVGTTAILLSLMYPKMQIHSFEPSPVNFQYLQHNVNTLGLQNRISVYNKAVSMKDESFEFEHAPDDSTSSRAVRLGKTYGNAPKQTFSVTTYPIMKFVEDHEDINFVKLDCEGCEFELLPMINKIYEKSPDCHFAGEFHARQLASLPTSLVDNTRNAMCKFSNRYVQYLAC